MNEKPTNITVNKKSREFIVNWDDGHVSVYPFGLLRAGCPCASCRGGHENMRSEPDPGVFNLQLEDSPATRISNVKAVGSYALTIVWEDGHDYPVIKVEVSSESHSFYTGKQKIMDTAGRVEKFKRRYSKTKKSA